MTRTSSVPCVHFSIASGKPWLPIVCSSLVPPVISKIRYWLHEYTHTHVCIYIYTCIYGERYVYIYIYLHTLVQAKFHYLNPPFLFLFISPFVLLIRTRYVTRQETTRILESSIFAAIALWIRIIVSDLSIKCRWKPNFGWSNQHLAWWNHHLPHFLACFCRNFRLFLRNQTSKFSPSCRLTRHGWTPIQLYEVSPTTSPWTLRAMSTSARATCPLTAQGAAMAKPWGCQCYHRRQGRSTMHTMIGGSAA